MQDFRNYLNEQMQGVSAAIWDSLSVQPDFDGINDQLADITDREIVHPEVVYEQVCQFLQTQGIELPPVTSYADEFLETGGELILPLVAPNETQEVVYLYFAFAQDETDLDYDVLAEIVTLDQLEDILNVDPNTESLQ